MVAALGQGLLPARGDVRFEFLLYDVTSTFFEGQAAANKKAARGYSRDQRSDCRQVCIGLVCTPEGLPLSFEVFAGNRTDVTTVEDIVTAIKAGEMVKVSTETGEFLGRVNE